MPGVRHYIIEGMARGRVVWWASARQSRAVVRHVQIALIDNGADYVHVTFYPGTGRSIEVAQVTNAGVWKWHDCPEAKRLRAYVEEER